MEDQKHRPAAQHPKREVLGWGGGVHLTKEGPLLDLKQGVSVVTGAGINLGTGRRRHVDEGKRKQSQVS